jgi:TolA-binding protein
MTINLISESMSKFAEKTKGPIFLILALAILLHLPECQAQDSSIQKIPSLAEEQDYAFAVGLYKDGVYQLADEQFVKFVQKYPLSLKRVEASFLQNECRFYSQKYPEAIKGF